MKLPLFVVGSILALSFAVPIFATADGVELGPPIVELMPHVEKLRAKLGLSAEQRDRLEAWIAEAPAKRKALEAETLEIRAQLREAILSGADRSLRDDLQQQLAANNTRLIEMRSRCTQMLRRTLSAGQFENVVASYRAE